MKGDYNRYLAEFLIDNNYNTASNNGKAAYERAKELSKHLASTHPVKLGLELNMSVFYYEILQQ